MAVRVTPFGKYLDTFIFCVKLTNKRGTTAEFLTYGATWHSYCIKDKDGNIVDIIVGPKDLEGYVQQSEGIPYYFGATIGRCAGRIQKGFWLNQTFYDLRCDNDIHLHGGFIGLDKKVWSIENINNVPYPTVTFKCQLDHLEENYPGNLTIMASFVLGDDNSLEICYKAVSDRDTIINLANHAYFNLGNDSIADHLLYIKSEDILVCDEKLIPIGSKKQVYGTNFNFTSLSPLSKIRRIGGLDHTFCHKDFSHGNPKIVYRAPSTGLELSISSNQLATVVFAPKRIEFVGQSKKGFQTTIDFPAICFEMQNYPDAPNHVGFPNVELKKGEQYVHRTLYQIKKER